MRFVFRFADELRWTLQTDAVLHEHSIVKHGCGCGVYHAAGIAEYRGCKDDVVGLPFARTLGRIHERNVLFVDARRLAVRVGGIVERVTILAARVRPRIAKSSAGSAKLVCVASTFIALRKNELFGCRS